MKKLTLPLIALALLASCSKNTYQHQEFYKRTYTGTITNIERNNVNGTTFVLNGITKVNVWDADLDTTLVVGSTAVFKLGRLTNPLKVKSND